MGAAVRKLRASYRREQGRACPPGRGRAGWKLPDRALRNEGAEEEMRIWEKTCEDKEKKLNGAEIRTILIFLLPFSFTIKIQKY